MLSQIIDTYFTFKRALQINAYCGTPNITFLAISVNILISTLFELFLRPFRKYIF